MLIILDLGANDGCSILKFKDILNKKNIIDYKIHSFEPIPFFNKYLNPLSNNKVIIYNKLISTNNNIQKLYLSQHTNDGSSIFNDKITNGISNDKYIICESIDIVSFINNLEKHDELWIKMDIEGGEYDIIPHLHKFNMLKKINKLFIEWHHNKINNISYEKHKKVVNLLNSIHCEDWDALDYSNNKKMKDKEYIKWIKNMI